MLYEPTQFDALIDEPWVAARIEDAIAAIVVDADAAFDPKALWPAHEWDAWEKPLPLSGLYVGAAGVIWALDELRKRGHAESSRDLAAAVVRAVELEKATPDFSADEHYRRCAHVRRDWSTARRLPADLRPDARGRRVRARSRERRQPDGRHQLGSARDAPVGAGNSDSGGHPLAGQRWGTLSRQPRARVIESAAASIHRRPRARA